MVQLKHDCNLMAVLGHLMVAIDIIMLIIENVYFEFTNISDVINVY